MTASVLAFLRSRLPVEYALDVVEVTVLIRPNMLEAVEKLEAVDVMEDCRYGSCA